MKPLLSRQSRTTVWKPRLTDPWKVWSSQTQLVAETCKWLGPMFGRTDFFAVFLGGRRIFSRTLSPDLISSFLWQKVPRKILQENPRQDPQKIIQQKSPTRFCRGAGPKMSATERKCKSAKIAHNQVWNNQVWELPRKGAPQSPKQSKNAASTVKYRCWASKNVKVAHLQNEIASKCFWTPKSQGQILGVDFGCGTPNSDWILLWILSSCVFQGNRPPKISTHTTPPHNSPGNLFGRIPLGFLQKAFLEKSGKSKRELSKQGLGPKGTNGGRKRPLGKVLFP